MNAHLLIEPTFELVGQTDQVKLIEMSLFGLDFAFTAVRPTSWFYSLRCACIIDPHLDVTCEERMLEARGDDFGDCYVVENLDLLHLFGDEDGPLMDWAESIITQTFTLDPLRVTLAASSFADTLDAIATEAMGRGAVEAMRQTWLAGAEKLRVQL